MHDFGKIHATFDGPNLIPRAGLGWVPVMALAQRASLADLAGEHLRISRQCRVNTQVKVSCVAATGQTAQIRPGILTTRAGPAITTEHPIMRGCEVMATGA
jgi:hypothetical protein